MLRSKQRVPLVSFRMFVPNSYRCSMAIKAKYEPFWPRETAYQNAIDISKYVQYLEELVQG